MSHSILYSLVRGFLELICHTANGYEIGGRSFCLSSDLQDRMDRFSDKIQYPSAFNRRPPKLRRCVLLDDSQSCNGTRTYVERCSSASNHVSHM